MRERDVTVVEKGSERSASGIGLSVAIREVLADDDPLRCKWVLSERAVFYPLGFAIEIVTNEREVLEIASRCWGNAGQLYAGQMFRIEIRVGDSKDGGCPPTPVMRASRHLVSIVADLSNHAACDLIAKFSTTYLSRNTLKHHDYLHYYFLDPVANLLVGMSHAVGLHAACVSLKGFGVLLNGPSGAGKSSLAYACARAGWIYTSDDGSFLVDDATAVRVVGNSRQVRFRPSARDLFPEIGHYDLTPRAAGKPSIEIPTLHFPWMLTSREALVGAAIFLRRQPIEAAELVLLPAGTAYRSFYEELFPVPEVRYLQSRVLQHLAKIDAYELRYEDIDQAVVCLRELVQRSTKT
ncbi:aldolase [Granulicella arctica]|uniref:aldolase n=1 Tax=Granulicella arctica TaxID=940613 RepID=UPI0021DF9C1E|nr:aldolase [Granulicella arctica]